MRKASLIEAITVWELELRTVCRNAAVDVGMRFVSVMYVFLESSRRLNRYK